MNRPTYTRRTLLGFGATIPLSGCLGLVADTMENDVPSSVPSDLRHESLGVVADGESVDIVTDADFTLVYFFATWCGPCEPQLENLREVRGEYASERLAMRAISPEEERSEVVDYWEKKGADWPAVIDPESDLHTEFGVSVYPSLILVDADGAVLWHTSGTTDTEVIVDEIDSQLE